MRARLTPVGPPAVALLVLAAIGLVCIGGLGGPAMAAESAGDCAGPGCEDGIACAREAATGPSTPARPSNAPVALAAGDQGMRAPEPTGVSAEDPPSPASAGPSLTRVGPRSPPAV